VTKELIADMKVHMEKSVDSLRKEYQRVRTGRASTTLLDDVKVDYYQAATLAVPEPRTITIMPWEAKLIPAIERAILKSDLGLNPMNDGKTIRLVLPALTEDRRKDIVKGLKRQVEDAKVAVRNIRRDAIEGIKKLEKDKKITEDDLKRAEKDIQDVTNALTAKIDEVFSHKEKEVMEV
jgi:ribosome recycling factor